MGGEGSVVLSLDDGSRRRVILQDLIALRVRFAFFRNKIGNYEHIFENIFEVIETPQWNEESTLVFDQLKKYGDELHRLYTSNTGFVLNPEPTNCPYCTKIVWR